MAKVYVFIDPSGDIAGIFRSFEKGIKYFKEDMPDGFTKADIEQHYTITKEELR